IYTYTYTCTKRSTWNTMPLFRKQNNRKLLDADAALGRLKAVGLGLALGGVVAVRRLPVELVTRTIVERRMRIDPNLQIRIPMKMHGLLRLLRDSHGDECPFPCRQSGLLLLARSRP